MTTEQTLGKRINWSAVMTAIGAGLAVIGSNLGTGIDSWGDWQHILWGAMLAAIAAYKGTAKGSLGRKPKPATLDTTDPVGKGG